MSVDINYTLTESLPGQIVNQDDLAELSRLGLATLVMSQA